MVQAVRQNVNPDADLLLSDVAALMPSLAALTSPEELTEVAIAIRDVCRCWP
jgi:hypothetical protein